MAWRNAGAWLRAFHNLPQGGSKPARQGEVVARFGAPGPFLPERLATCVGNGDYVARNMFVDESGRVTVFDSMPRWRVPRLEDVCRLMVGMGLSGLQVNSHGAGVRPARARPQRGALPVRPLRGRRRADASLRCYQLLILLDKWSALVDSDSSDRGWRASARAVLTRPGNAFVAREARRLIALTDTPASSLPPRRIRRDGGRGRHAVGSCPG